MLPIDRPEQGLDMIQEAMTQYELTPGEDFYIALNLAGHEIFDYVSMICNCILTVVSFPFYSYRLSVGSVFTRATA